MVADIPIEEVSAKRAQMDELLRQFQDGLQDHRVALARQHSEVPTRLHHYTTPQGLLGIVSDCSIWASDVRFMNDSSEFSYAAHLIDEVMAEVIAEVSSDVLRALLPTRPGVANAFEYGDQPFIACFCEEGDLLSQWRGYSAGDSGFSLGLDLHHWALSPGLPPRTYLRKVVYDRDAQRSSVREVVKAWLATAESLLDSGRAQPQDVFPYPAIWALQEALAEHHLCFKDPAFAEEREWRLIRLVNVREEIRLLDDKRNALMLAATHERMRQLGVDMPEHQLVPGPEHAEGIDIQFRPSALGLVPYVELGVRDTAGVFTGRLPLWEVVQGPTRHPEVSLASLSMYLDSEGYGFHTKVSSTGIPLRAR